MSLGPNLQPSYKKTVLTWHFYFTSYYYFFPIQQLACNVKIISLFKQFNGKQFSFASDVKTQITTADSRPQKNGQSTDDVQPRWPFVITNIRFTGHFDWTHKTSDQKKIYIYTALRFKGTNILFYSMFQLVGVGHSCYYRVFFTL